MKVRVITYVDGFNLYHALDNLRRSELKWLDLWKLTEHFIDPNHHEIVGVKYFSAYAHWLDGPVERHREYVAALSAVGVTPIMGHFKDKGRKCPDCSHRWTGHEEKETDVNLALGLVADAYKDLYDEAFVISRDSDLGPAVRMVLKDFPHKKIKMLAPPRLRHSKELAQAVGKNKLATIKDIHLERSLLPERIEDQNSGDVIALRPEKYSPA